LYGIFKFCDKNHTIINELLLVLKVVNRTIMKKTILLVLLTFSLLMLYSCNNDDDDNDKILTFLEQYKGTTWISEGDNYFRFGSTNSPLEHWTEFYYENCWEHIIMSEYFKNIDIIENSENTLIFKGYDSDTYYIYYTFKSFTKSQLKVIVDGNDEGNEMYEEGIIEKSDYNVDNFKICDW